MRYGGLVNGSHEVSIGNVAIRTTVKSLLQRGGVANGASDERCGVLFMRQAHELVSVERYWDR